MKILGSWKKAREIVKQTEQEGRDRRKAQEERGDDLAKKRKEKK